MAEWQLGIDFGTSYTVAAVLEAGQVKVVDVESGGQSRIPSVAFLNADGDILVGTNAQHQAVFAPERFEPSPKRCIGDGEVFLGDRFVPVAELISAVLRKVYAEACRQHGGGVPSATRVTHPAEWAETRLNVLRSAIEGANLPHPVLVPEPVAAAAWIAMAKTEPGQHIAVYDFGGGTFDAAVLRRTESGFEVAGPPSGRDPLGGEDLDRRIIEHVGRLLASEAAEEWSQLMNPPDASWRRSAVALRAEVQRAKETLSDVLVCQLWIPGVEREIQLTRSELDEIVAADISETVTSLAEAIEAAGLTPAQLAGIYLVGGSSRIPKVADTIWREFTIRPAVQDDPKAVVAMGAAAWGSPLIAASTPVAGVSVVGGAPDGPGTPPAPSVRRFQPHLAMVKGTGARGTGFNALLVLEQPGGPALRLRDESANGRDVRGLVAASGELRAARMGGYVETSVVPADVLGMPGGFERRFEATGPNGRMEMFERYLVAGERAMVLAGPEDVREVADGIVITAARLPEDKYFEGPFEVVLPAGWMASERLVMTQAGTGHQVTADHFLPPGPVTAPAWEERQVQALLRQVAGAAVAGTVPARVLGRLDGAEVSVRSRQGRTTVITKLWLAVQAEHDAYSVTVALRERDQALFAPLAAQALLNPSAGILHRRFENTSPR